jgi:RNA polymerase-interacting CarD/CdnL/TRCF family regulator
MEKNNIKNMKEYLNYCFKIINEKPIKSSKTWTHLYEKYYHCMKTTKPEEIAYVINYLKQFDYNEKTKDYLPSKRLLLDNCLERLAFTSLMENEKFQSMDSEVNKIIKKLNIKNYFFTNPGTFDEKNLKEIHKKKYSEKPK